MATEEFLEEDLYGWIGFQEWLVTEKLRVKIPFAEKLAELSNPADARFRRDFRLLLNLIKTHAILHQLNHKRDDVGQIIANLNDYEVVHGLVADTISEGLGATVSDAVRETVNVVGKLDERIVDIDEPMSLVDVAENFGIDNSSASRRVKQAIKLGYLMNVEHIMGKPMKLYHGDPLPDEVQVIPRPEEIKIKGEDDPPAVYGLDD